MVSPRHLVWRSKLTEVPDDVYSAICARDYYALNKDKNVSADDFKAHWDNLSAEEQGVCQHDNFCLVLQSANAFCTSRNMPCDEISIVERGSRVGESEPEYCLSC